VDVDADAVAGALDFDPCNTSTVEFLLEEFANLDVFGDIVTVTLTLGGRVGEQRDTWSVVIPRRNP